MKRIICALFSFSLLGIMCVCYCVDSNVVKENLNFSKTQETYDMLSFPAIPECISLSKNKYIGISFNEGSQKKSSFWTHMGTMLHTNSILRARSQLNLQKKKFLFI